MGESENVCSGVDYQFDVAFFRLFKTCGKYKEHNHCSVMVDGDYYCGLRYKIYGKGQPGVVRKINYWLETTLTSLKHSNPLTNPLDSPIQFERLVPGLLFLPGYFLTQDSLAV